MAGARSKMPPLFVFVVDGREGLVPADLEIAEAVRAKGRPVIVAINKADDKRAKAGALDFYELGFEPVMEISAEHGLGIGDLLDEVIERLPEAKSEEQKAEEPEPRIAIVGRPNVGKSSLVNRILREERMLVSDVAGTTRDSVDTNFRWHQRQFRIVDTAGIRKPGRVARAGRGRIGQRAAGEARDCRCRPHRARHRRDAWRGRSGRRDCRRGGARGAQRHHRREQVGPDEGRGPGFSRRRSTTSCAST